MCVCVWVRYVLLARSVPITCEANESEHFKLKHHFPNNDENNAIPGETFPQVIQKSIEWYAIHWAKYRRGIRNLLCTLCEKNFSLYHYSSVEFINILSFRALVRISWIWKFDAISTLCTLARRVMNTIGMKNHFCDILVFDWNKASALCEENFSVQLKATVHLIYGF